jgi:hypothetical protein
VVEAERHRVYIETSVVSRFDDGRTKRADWAALGTLLSRSDLEWVSSSLTRGELAQATDPAKRDRLVTLARQLYAEGRWHVVERSSALGRAALGRMVLGGSSRHPLLTALMQVFDPADAEHIAQARLTGCRFFLTLDRRTILDRVPTMPAALVAQLAPLELCSPTSLLRRLGDLSDASATSPRT